jgi:hypothetical protein
MKIAVETTIAAPIGDGWQANLDNFTRHVEGGNDDGVQ